MKINYEIKVKKIYTEINPLLRIIFFFYDLGFYGFNFSFTRSRFFFITLTPPPPPNFQNKARWFNALRYFIRSRFEKKNMTTDKEYPMKDQVEQMTHML